MSRDDGRRITVGALLVAAAVLLLLWSTSCKDPYTIALRSAASLRATMATVEQSMADACHVKHVGCLESHGAGTPGFIACSDPCVKALTAWTKYTRPGFNTAILAFVAGVELARSIKDRAALLVLMQPLVCAVARGSEQWIHVLPASARATVEAIARGVAGYVCKEVP